MEFNSEQLGLMLYAIEVAMENESDDNVYGDLAELFECVASKMKGVE